MQACGKIFRDKFLRTGKEKMDPRIPLELEELELHCLKAPSYSTGATSAFLFSQTRGMGEGQGADSWHLLQGLKGLP